MKISIRLFLYFLLLSIIGCQKNEPVKDNDIQIDFDACLTEVSASSLDIMTWNIKEFPVRGQNTIHLVSDLIKAQDPDLVAFQEITDHSDFALLLDNLSGWEGYIDLSSELNLAFIYKIEEVNAIGDPVPLFKDNDYAFPRSPLLMTIRHNDIREVFLINIHLKCCSGVDNILRRRSAGQLLKEYIDEKLPEDPVIVLGDFNDEIVPLDSAENVFYSFLKDSLHYKFADMEIARGVSSGWSYPSWPSHIDHILITDELFDHNHGVYTLKLDDCDQRYFPYISDHRPLLIRIQ